MSGMSLPPIAQPVVDIAVAVAADAGLKARPMAQSQKTSSLITA